MKRLTCLMLIGLVLLVAPPSAAGAQEPASDGVVEPNAGRPLSHEELLWARGELRDRSYRSTTLVADTIIVRDGSVRSIEEPRPFRRGVGVLPRDERYPGDPVVQGSRPVRALYPEDGSAIEGRLAFALDVAGIQLLGTVESPAGTYLTPIEPEALSTADSLPAGALITVHGWLSSLGSRETCPELPEALDPHDSGGWGDPFVRCPGGWLTAEEVRATDPSDPLLPSATGIPVQWGALERFTRDMGVQRAATYLLRHMVNPVEGAVPALGWQVIGRLDAVETEAELEPAPLTEATRPGGLEWRPVIERQPAADTRAIASTAWDGGFASVHVGQDRVLSSWVSGDGGSWRFAELPSGITWVSALAPLRDGLAIIADEQRYGRAWSFEVWTSSDGLSWREASRQRIPTPERFAEYRRIVHGYWPIDGGIVAIQTYTQQACCGSAPGTMLLATREGARREPDVTFTWTSRDGRRWERQRTRGIHAYPGTHLGWYISAGDGELLAMWPDEPRRLGRSADGVQWRTIGTYPAELDLYSPFVLTRTEGGFVVAGEPWDSGISDGNAIAVWRSPTARAWERTMEPRQGAPSAIASVGPHVIVAGDRLDPDKLDEEDIPRLPWLLVSSDEAVTWDDSLSWFGDSPWCLEALTEGEGTVLLDVGCAPADAATSHLANLDG